LNIAQPNGAGSLAGLPILADFNNDGKIDLATIDGVTNSERFFLGNGDVRCLTGNSYRGGSRPYSLATADFNEDGMADLAVTGDIGNNAQIDVWLGKADGTFGPPIPFVRGCNPDETAWATSMAIVFPIL
jgi:hypothetical protein